MSSSSAEIAVQFDAATRLVEDVMGRLGLDAANLRANDGPDVATWTVQRGSATILVSVAKSDLGEAAYFRAISPLMSLPSGDPLPLFRRLLELNGRGLINASFGIVGDRVVAKSERPTAFLDAAEVEQIIVHLSAVADTYDDRLVKEFGGQRSSDLTTP
jgi:hypothetical protein